MKKSLKGFLALFLAAVLALGASPLAGVASLHLSLPLRGLFTVRSSAATSGSCGSNATFTISGGTLTVSGTGNIDDYYGEVDPPWYGETFTRVVVQSGITGIGAYAFYDNGNLTGVTLPNTVTTIGNGAFCYCPSLTSFTVPDSVTEVGTGVFAEDQALVSVHIGAGLNDEDVDFDYFFDGAYALTSVTAAAGHPTLYTENGILYNKAKTALIFCPEAKTGAVTMPATVVTVFDYACEYCAQITGITFSNALKYIGEYAFCGCDSLTNLNIPDSVTAIGDYAFEYCIDLTTASIGSGLETFNNTMFDGCGNMTAVNFSAANPNYASHDGAVYDKGKTTLLLCPIGKTAVVFPATVTAIGERAFANCAELTSISLPNSVQSVEDEAFNYCEKLQTVAFGTGLVDLGYDVFFFCNELKSISVAAGNTSFKAESGVLFNFAKTVLLAYPQNKAGASYAVPATVKTIGDSAVQQNQNLTSVTFPSGLTKIDDYAFYNSGKFRNFTVPAGLLDIGYDAFDGTDWYEHLPEGQVAYAGKVAYAYIPSQAYDYEMPEGYNLTFRADTTAVAAGAFAYEKNLAGVTFPATLIWIGEGAFYGCESLKQVAVPKTVTTIGDYALGYTYVDDVPELLPGFKMYCSAGSPAHIYAQNNNITRYVPATPGSLKASSTAYNSIKVSWSKADDYVTAYLVYRATSAGGPYSYIGNTGKTTFSYTDTGRTTGVTYYYKIIAQRVVLGTKLYSAATAAVSAVPVPAVPGSVKAARYSSTSIKVSWAAVPGATGYAVYRYSPSTGTYVKIKTTTSTSYVNGGLSRGVTYYYKVRAYRTVSGKNWYGGYSARVSAKTY